MSAESIPAWAKPYEIRKYNSVVEFVNRNPFLKNILPEVYEKISEYFGPHTGAALELFVPPYSEAETSELFALIQTNLEVDESVDRLKKLDEEWWIDALPRAQCCLSIDVEYI